jgi:hypothetical protein
MSVARFQMRTTKPKPPCCRRAFRKERIHIERFGVALPSGAPVGAVLHRPNQATPLAKSTIIRDGLQREIALY